MKMKLDKRMPISLNDQVEASEFDVANTEGKYNRTRRKD